MRRPAWADDAELTTIFAPSPDRRRAIAAPIPLDEPVTMTTLPVSFMLIPRRVGVVQESTGSGCVAGLRGDYRTDHAGRARAADPHPALWEWRLAAAPAGAWLPPTCSRPLSRPPGKYESCQWPRGERK